MQGISLLPTVAYRVNEWLSLGAGLTAMYGVFELRTAVDNTPLTRADSDDGELELKDEDWGFGGNFGVLVEPAEGTRIGLTYLTETKLDFKDSPELTGVSVGRFADLDGHRLESLDLDLGMTVPQSVMLSAFQQVTDRLALLANVGWQDWSEFGKVEVDIEAARAGKSITADLDYEDTWHAALGAQYQVSEPWLLSCGVAYDSALYDDDQRGPVLPLSEQWRFGLGAQYAWSQALTLSGAYEAAWGGKLPMDVERGEEMRVSGDYRDVVLHVLNVNLDWKF
jgi:long-chain fatty acid transport protein